MTAAMRIVLVVALVVVGAVGVARLADRSERDAEAASPTPTPTPAATVVPTSAPASGTGSPPPTTSV